MLNATMPQVMPFYINYEIVKIRCPLCNKIHTHGSCGGVNYQGSRVAHCSDMPGTEYNIIRNPELDAKMIEEEMKQEK